MKNFLSVCFTIFSIFLVIGIISYFNDKQRSEKWEQKREYSSKLSNVYSGCWVNKEEDNDFFELRLSDSDSNGFIIINGVKNPIALSQLGSYIENSIVMPGVLRPANKYLVKKQEEYGKIPDNSRSRIVENLQLLSDPSDTPYISSKLVYLGRDSSAESTIIRESIYEKNDDICTDVKMM